MELFEALKDIERLWQDNYLSNFERKHYESFLLCESSNDDENTIPEILPDGKVHHDHC